MATSFDPQTYWEKRLTQHFNLKGVGDIGLPESYNHFLYKIRSHVFRRSLRSTNLDITTANVLDIGSGVGFYIAEWMNAGASSVHGCDITNVVVEKLTSQYPSADFSQIDIGDQETCLPESSFDAISCLDVLFHITDDKRFESAIQNIAKCLKPNGVFIYSDNLVEKGFRYDHQVGRTKQEIIETLGNNGLSIARSFPMFILTNDPSKSKSLIHRKFFSMLYRTLNRFPQFGAAIGSALYPIELLMLHCTSYAPSTELLICKKTDSFD